METRTDSLEALKRAHIAYVRKQAGRQGGRARLKAVYLRGVLDTVRVVRAALEGVNRGETVGSARG